MNLLSIIIAVLLLAAVLRGRYLGFVRSLLSLGGRFVVYAVAVLMSHRLGSWIHETFLMTVQARWAANGVPEFVSDKANEFLASGLAFGINVTDYWNEFHCAFNRA
ncbi:MAG: CvpA family protein [Weissella confusa]